MPDSNPTNEADLPLENSPTVSSSGHPKLARRLNAIDLVAIGLAALVGTGIFVITGTAAATRAGPAVALSFVFGAISCGLTALCYSELASSFPNAGSAYSYAHLSMGRFAAWTVGWALALEYTVAAVLVAIGWSGYFVNLLENLGIHLPPSLCRGFFDGGLVNLPAVMLITVVTILLLIGVKESARAATLLVLIKIGVIVLFLVLGTPHVNSANWKPFLPFGWKGVFAGTGMIFFSYIGFDAITTAAEETKNPQRDIAIGILGSLLLCTLLYVSVSLVVTGIVPYTKLDHPAPVAMALENIGVEWGHMLVTIGGLIGMTSVVLVMMMGQPRIFMAMSRDKLIPKWLAAVHPRFKTPHLAIMLTSALILVGAGLLPLSVAGEMTSIGTLFAFISVCIGVIILRKKRPDLKRGFRVPWSPWVPGLGALVCVFIMLQLSQATWIAFGVWTVLGFLVYRFYGRRFVDGSTT